MRTINRIFVILVVLIFFSVTKIFPFDLKEIKAKGELRHLGVPYANFVTGSGDGFSVDIMKLFAKHLGVKYKFVKSDWRNIISDLTGKKILVKGGNVKIIGQCEIKGDVIATGLTVLKWRQELVDYSDPVFPTQIWLVASVYSNLKPINPSGNIDNDIDLVLKQLKGHSILSVENTCLDANLYNLTKYGVRIINFKGKLNELVPAIMNTEADATLLDVPDALVALEKFPGLIKVIGPISKRQVMAVAFRKSSTKLRQEFNRFLKKIKKEGIYFKLVKKYYPYVLDYYPEFFK